jgi:protein O-mannosyl-transferase
MAQKKNKQTPNVSGSPAKNPPGIPKQSPANRNTAAQNNSFIIRYAQPLIVAGIALVTFLFLKVCIDNQFTNWDDLGYIISDPLIKDSSAKGIANIFSINNPVMGNYHPLTILLYAIEYSYVGLQPWLYHLDSLILHVLVTISVYFFVRVLTHRTVAAVIVALLFGLHPMHVESIAWAAGRKDVLYGLFFILSLTTYVHYIRTEGSKKTIWYISGILLFAISLLAKSVAVSLPVTMLLIDYFENRKWSFKLLVEKIPHFALALLFGILSVKAQDKIGALASLDAHFNPLERIALGAYALFTYLWKAIAPLELSNFYPYPLKENGALPGYYYVYPVIIAALLFVVWRFARKNKAVIFGLGFFIINIFLLLQFIPVGGAIISDRYGYIPYLGLFFILGWFVSGYFEPKAKIQTGKVLLAGSLLYCFVLGYMAYQRCNDWHDSISIWNDDIEKHPEAPVGYFYLGQEYDVRFGDAVNEKEKALDRDSAYYNFSLAILHKPDYTNALICMGELQRNMGQVNEAEKTFFTAMNKDSTNANIFNSLGIIYGMKGNYDSSAYYLKKALHLLPNFADAHSNYANLLDILGKPDSSLQEYAASISFDPTAHIAYLNRARIYYAEKKDYDAAIADYNKVIQLKPELGEPYYLRSKCYFQKGNKAQALQDVEKAKSLGFAKIDPNYYQQLKP